MKTLKMKTRAITISQMKKMKMKIGATVTVMTRVKRRLMLRMMTNLMNLIWSPGKVSGDSHMCQLPLPPPTNLAIRLHLSAHMCK